MARHYSCLQELSAPMIFHTLQDISPGPSTYTALNSVIHMVASSLSIYSDAETNQSSILSLGKMKTSQRMHEHLEKELFGGYPPNNLIGLRKRSCYHNGGRLLRNSKIQRTVLSGFFIVSHGHWVVHVIS
jgi:hypothetical protein